MLLHGIIDDELMFFELPLTGLYKSKMKNSHNGRITIFGSSGGLSLRDSTYWKLTLLELCFQHQNVWCFLNNFFCLKIKSTSKSVFSNLVQKWIDGFGFQNLMDLRTQHEQWELYLLFLRQNLNTGNLLLPPFQNIRCFSFMKQMYLDIF
jgi:hypothetical protein